MKDQDVVNIIAELSGISNKLSILISETYNTNILLEEIYQELPKSNKVIWRKRT
jgi:hypothetical protein